MTKKRKPLQKRIKSQRLQNTKKLSAFTHISKKSPVTTGEAEVEGVSMWPLLRTGFRVKFKKVDPETLEPGDIIVLKGEDRKGQSILQVHRLLDRVGPFFLEAGDNGFAASLVSAPAILGLVTAAYDRSGKSVLISRVPPDTMSARFKFFRGLAHAFVYAHEFKDRAMGQVKSPLLWRASVVYRKGLSLMGIKVPVIYPR